MFNAANEVCVDAFHDGGIGFLDIVDVVGRVLTEHLDRAPDSSTDVPSLWRSDDDLTIEGVLAADAWARERARQLTTRT